MDPPKESHGSPAPEPQSSPTSTNDHQSSTPPSKHTTHEPQHVKETLRSAADRTLFFLSNASNETLAGCLIGLGATTYIILGRVGLVLIGVVGGVIAHATWEGSNGARDIDTKAKEVTRRNEVGVDVARRLLHWREKSLDRPNSDRDALGIAAKISGMSSNYSDFRPDTASALNKLTDAIIRDYVNWWYSPILPTELSFPSACRHTLISFILSLSNHISRKRPVDTFLEFTTNSSSIVIVFFNELSTALNASPGSTADDAIRTYLRMKPESNLASIMDQKHQQRKLSMAADDILESYLEPQVYTCAPTRAFLRQILSTVILGMTIQRCSKPEYINAWIVYILEDGEPEIMNAIDAGVESAAGNSTTEQKNVPEPTSPVSKASTRHQRVVSRAEEAMDEAMREADRLTKMIQAEEEERKKREQHQKSDSIIESDTSDSNTQGVTTPTSSHSDLNTDEEKPASLTGPELRSSTSSTENAPPQPVFTSFDQLAPSSVSNVPTALTASQDELKPQQQEVLTLTKANISIFDDTDPKDKRALKAKPIGDFLIQVEPASIQFAGWMLARTYADFETLHEVLRRISNISGINFNTIHSLLPMWKGKTKVQLKEELERYLGDAVRYEQLAESEGMKRFLERDRGLTRSPGNKTNFWPTPVNVGKGMLDALTKTPNQVAGGGKALLGGVSSILGAGGPASRKSVPAPIGGSSLRLNLSTSSVDLGKTSDPSPVTPSDQEGLKRSPSLYSAGAIKPSLIPRRSSSQITHDLPSGTSPVTSIINDSLKTPVKETPNEFTAPRTPDMKLPPPPDAMPDDYEKHHISKVRATVEHTSQMSVDGTSFFDVPTPSTPSSRSPRQKSSANSPRSSIQLPRQRPMPILPTPIPPTTAAATSTAIPRKQQPLSETEAQVTIELWFAVINELYTLSSAWNIRRTLLAAAKSFLLRPGNPQLESIRLLLQETVLDANISDAGIAGHLLKLRENSLPTEEELKTWPKEASAEEKETLRKKAKKLLMERGMPQALTSVMGSSASGEALGKVFECLQVEDVARGVVFGLMLQGIRAVTQ